MSEITLEKTHALLEKLAAYVMSELPTRKELDEKLARKADKEDIIRVYQILETKADKVEVERVEHKVNLILEGMDTVSKELDVARTERVAVSKTLDVYNERLGDLEEHVFGARVRDEEDEDHDSKKA